MAIHVAPDPFDAEVERVLNDPKVVAKLDAIEQRERDGTLVTYTHDEARAMLKAKGVPLSDELPDDL